MLLADVRHDYVRTYYKRARRRRLRGRSQRSAPRWPRDGTRPARQRGRRADGHALRRLPRPALRRPGVLHCRCRSRPSEIRGADGAAIQRRFDETARAPLRPRRRRRAARAREPAPSRRSAARPQIAFPSRARHRGRGARRHAAPSISTTPARAVRLPGLPARAAARRAAEIEGPAVIEEYASTTVLFPGDRCSVRRHAASCIVTVATELGG